MYNRLLHLPPPHPDRHLLALLLQASLGFRAIVVRLALLLICACMLAKASTNTWTGGTGSLTTKGRQTQILTNGGGTWQDTGSTTSASRTEIRNSNTSTAPGQRLMLEVHNEVSVLAIYSTTRGQSNIVNTLTVKSGGKIQCGTFCNDGNSLYIGSDRSAQLINLRLEARASINGGNRGRINVNGGYLGVVYLDAGASILGEGIKLNNNAGLSTVNNSGNISGLSCGTVGCGSVEEVQNKAGGTITSIAGSNTHYINITKSITNQGSIGTINKANVNQTLSTSGSIGTVSWSNINTFNVSGGTVGNITNNNISNLTVSGGKIDNISNNTINGTLTVSAGNVANISGNNQTLNNLNITGGTVANINNIKITNLNNNGGTITNLTASTNVSRLNNAGGTITNLTLSQNIEYNPNTNAHINGSITNLTIRSFNIELQSASGTWNAHTITNRGQDNEHLYIQGSVTNLNILPGAIHVAVGNGVDEGIYLYDKIILNGSTKQVNFSHLTPAQGLSLYDFKTGFSLSANAQSSFGASALQSIQLNDTRRIVIIQNILDSINYHHFYRTSIKRQEGKEQANKDSLAQKVDTSNWQKKRTFAIPYGLYGNLSVNNTKSNTYAGGAIFGVQRDFGHLGIGILYLGYEYNSTTSQLSVANATLNANVAQGGVAHIKLLKSEENKQFYLKSNLRSTLTHLKINAKENKNLYDASTFTYHIGGAVRGGMAYYFDSMSYIAPEIGVSYDLMSVADFEIEKGALANEVYPTHNVHLPQLSASMKYYKAIGQFYRYSILVGGRYSPNNKPTLKFQNGIFSDESRIYLPLFYANVDASFSHAISRVSELGVSYNGLAYNGGSSHSLSVKYVKWF